MLKKSAHKTTSWLLITQFHTEWVDLIWFNLGVMFGMIGYIQFLTVLVVLFFRVHRRVLMNPRSRPDLNGVQVGTLRWLSVRTMNLRLQDHTGALLHLLAWVICLWKKQLHKWKVRHGDSILPRVDFITNDLNSVFVLIIACQNLIDSLCCYYKYKDVLRFKGKLYSLFSKIL